MENSLMLSLAAIELGLRLMNVAATISKDQNDDRRDCKAYNRLVNASFNPSKPRQAERENVVCRRRDDE